jgi:hypothetical protein
LSTKKAVWFICLTCVAAFGQSTSDNALKKRMLRMNLLNPPAPMPVVLAGPVATPSKVCACGEALFTNR